MTRVGIYLFTMQPLFKICRSLKIFRWCGLSTSAFSVGETTCFATDAAIIDEFSGYDKLAFCYILYRAFSMILAERLKTTSAELVNTKKQLDRVNKKTE